MKNYTTNVKRGKHRGALLRPHRYAAGHFLVTKRGNTAAFSTKVANESELENWVLLGYGIRMSAPGVAASIYCPASLQSS